MPEILNNLKGGDRRSIGKVDDIVHTVLEQPDLFDTLFNGMLSDDALLRMRAADAVEKITRTRPDLLQPHKQKMMDQVAAINQQEVRWHVAQMLPRMAMNTREQEKAVDILLEFLNDKSKIVKTCSMQALAELAEKNRQILPEIIRLLAELTRTGSPAMKSRGRKLLDKLQKRSEDP
jgi:HEAT repeat protein